MHTEQPYVGEIPHEERPSSRRDVRHILLCNVLCALLKNTWGKTVRLTAMPSLCYTCYAL